MIAIDLFSGVGGLSLGAAQSGFTVGLAVDNDLNAASLHHTNFPACLFHPADVATVTGADLVSRLNQKPALVMGGAPCVAFSRIGKKRADDPRSNLFFHLFRLVNETQPLAYLAENVPGILDAQHDPIRQSAVDQLQKQYWSTMFTVHAEDCGAPTSRTRVFFAGVHKSVGISPQDIWKTGASSTWAPEAVDKLCVGDALTGLPVDADENSCEWRVVGNLSHNLQAMYQPEPPIGVGDPLAINRVPVVSGFAGTKHSPEVLARFACTEQGCVEPVSRFPRLDPLGLCPTLRAGTGSANGNHTAARPIHPTEPRVITVREAARLQGFPDYFQFSRQKYLAHRQIGNSVCPPMAKAILTPLAKALSSIDSRGFGA